MTGPARSDRLRSALKAEGPRVILAQSSPSPAGVALVSGSIVCNIDRVSIMADALSESDFDAFAVALCSWARFALQFADDGHPDGLASVLGRLALLERDPRAVSLLDAVFDLEER